MGSGQKLTVSETYPGIWLSWLGYRLRLIETFDPDSGSPALKGVCPCHCLNFARFLVYLCPNDVTLYFTLFIFQVLLLTFPYFIHSPK